MGGITIVGAFKPNKFYVIRKVKSRKSYDYRRMSKSHENIFARRLREARLKAGFSQEKLGVLIGLDESCSSARISRYESGIHMPPIETTVSLAKHLNVPLAFLFCDDDAMAKNILVMYGKSALFMENVYAYMIEHDS